MVFLIDVQKSDGAHWVCYLNAAPSWTGEFTRRGYFTLSEAEKDFWLKLIGTRNPFVRFRIEGHSRSQRSRMRKRAEAAENTAS